MGNPMKYIKDLEAAGFERNQAEAQVQMVLEVLEGDLVTKSDFAVFQERLENRFANIDYRFEHIEVRLDEMNQRFNTLKGDIQSYVHSQIKESEFRTVTRLGILNVSTVTIAVAVLSWIIKV